MLDPITKYILSEQADEEDRGQKEKFKDIDRKININTQAADDMRDASEDNLRKMAAMPTEVLNRFMFEYISHDDCPPNHTKDPQTGKCVKNPYDEEIDSEEYGKGKRPPVGHI